MSNPNKQKSSLLAIARGRLARAVFLLKSELPGRLARARDRLTSGAPYALWARLLGSMQWRKGLPLAGRVGLQIAAMGITTFVFLTLNRRYYVNQVGFDEEYFVWGGWSISKGMAPYRDFLEFKPPMVFITHYFAQALFGFKDLAYRGFFAVFPLTSILALQLALVARGIGRAVALAVMLAIVVLFVSPPWHDTALSDCESIGLSYYMLGLACLLWEGRGIKVTTVLGGVFFSCCVLSKEPFGLVVVFSWLALFWLRGRGTPSRDSAKLYAKYSLLGVVVMIAALCIYMVPSGAMKSYIDLVRSYSTIYRDPKRSYCILLGVAHEAPPLVALQETWDKIRASFLNENVLGYLLPILLPGAVFTLRRSKPLLAVTLLAFAGGLAAPPMSNCMWTHYYVMSMAGVIFALVVSADSSKDLLRSAGRTTRWGTSAVLLLLVGLHGFPEISKEWKARATYQRQPWSEPQPGLRAFIVQNTTPADRIFTTGAPILYPQTDRLSAVRESAITDEMLGTYEGNTDEEKLRHIYRQLVKYKPKVVFLDSADAGRKVRTIKALMMPYLAEFKYRKINDQLYLRP